MSSSFPSQALRVQWAGATHVGKKRSNNEDRFFMSSTEPFAVVADGMGGHAAGEVAAALAVEYIAAMMAGPVYAVEEFWPGLAPAESVQQGRVQKAIQGANQHIYAESTLRPACNGMGTTVVAALFFDQRVVVAHVGDSRLYRFRQGHLQQLTDDHSLQNSYAKQSHGSGGLNIPKNVILRALGIQPSVQVDVSTHEVKPDDVYLLCSDGLTDMVPDEQLTACLRQEDDLQSTCEQLIEHANQRGGIDNITVVLARVEEMKATDHE